MDKKLARVADPSQRYSSWWNTGSVIRFWNRRFDPHTSVTGAFHGFIRTSGRQDSSRRIGWQ